MESKETVLKVEEQLKLLQRENALLNSIVQGAPESIYAKDLECRYLSINPAGAAYLGLSVDQVIGRTDEEILGEEGKLIMARDIMVYQTEKPVVYESDVVMHGEPKQFGTSKTPLFDASGELIGLIGVSRDITTFRSAQEKYQFIFDNAPIGFWEEDFSRVKVYLDELKTNGVTDFRKYFTDNPKSLSECIDLIRIINVNLATLRMNGTDNKKAFIQRLNRNFTTASEGIYAEEFAALAEGRTFYQSEGAFVNENGETLTVQFNLNVMPGKEEDLSLVLVSVIDLTESKKIESELSSIRLRYQSIVDEQTQMICRISSKGIVTFGNRAFKDFFVDEDFENPVVEFFSLYPKEEVQRCKKYLKELSPKNQTCVCEVRNYDKDGELVWQSWTLSAFYSNSGTLVGYQAVGSDITERRITEEALAASESRWRSIFEQAEDLILSVNSSGLILSINDYRGLPPFKLAGQSIKGVLSPLNYKVVKPFIDQIFNDRKSLKRELKIISSGGNSYTFNCSGTPIFYNNRVLSATIIARDVTKEKEAEKRTQKALIEGQESERTRVSQELHDGLGQLFTAIKFNLQHLKTGMGNANVQEIENRLATLEDHIGTAIQEVKNISRNLMPDVLDQFGLRPALEDLVQSWIDAAKFKLSLEMVDADGRFDSEVEKAIFRVCQELINNSVRHSNARQIFVQVINHGESILLMVEDDGVGYDIKSITKGFGLKNIQSRVDLLEGRVEVDSGPDSGTLTTIEIPLIKEEEE